MHLLGIDIGTSSIKTSVLDGKTGKCIATAIYPETESPIISKQTGWAEQEPEMWWNNLKTTLKLLVSKFNIDLKKIEAIGISYQMHGLVIVDQEQKPLRPSIIWCDSRAVETGNKAFKEIGEQKCLKNLLNSPGNFTASKLKWVKDHEPDIYKKIYKIMLPGDYIAMKLSGEINTTVSGLSEGIFWNFKENKIANLLLDYYGFSHDIIPDLIPTFTNQLVISKSIAEELGLKPGTKISYRAGDQPNNALSLNVLNPGEIAATGGTSGVVYGVTDQIKFDPQSRVNTFAHVNHTSDTTRLGVLLCINGTGIMNSWLRKNIGNDAISYKEMNKLASAVPVGSEGLSVLPFGNGAERMLGNKIVGAHFAGLHLNLHSKNHIFRAAQEGIAFSFKYGIDIMNKEVGINPSVIRAGYANLFLSPVFCKALSCISNSAIELYETDGALGAARGAGIGAGYYQDFDEAFSTLKKLQVIEPDKHNIVAYHIAYKKWLQVLKKNLV
jgi:xylulokinase